MKEAERREWQLSVGFLASVIVVLMAVIGVMATKLEKNPAPGKEWVTYEYDDPIHDIVEDGRAIKFRRGPLKGE